MSEDFRRSEVDWAVAGAAGAVVLAERDITDVVVYFHGPVFAGESGEVFGVACADVMDVMTYTVSRETLPADGGDVRWWADWVAEDSRLKPIKFRYKLPPGAKFGS